MKSQIAQNGFTLIEMLVVIAIIGVLASATLLLIDPVRQIQKAHDGQRKADVQKMQSAFEQYRADAGYYPKTSVLASCGSGVALSYNSSTYLQSIPCDPKTPHNPYKYTASPSGCDNSGTMCSSYTITACLENNSDPDKDSSIQGGCSIASKTFTSP